MKISVFRNLAVKPVKMALYNLKHNILSVKFMVISVIMAYFYYRTYCSLWGAAARTGEGVTAFLVPAMLSGTEEYMIFILCFIAFVGDMPFHNENLMYIRARAGRMQVFSSNALTVFVSSVFFAVFIYFENFLFFIVKPEFTGRWGECIRSVCEGATGMYGTKPYVAFAVNFLVLFLVFLLLGNVVFALNDIFNSYAGTIFAVALVFISDLLYYIGGKYNIDVNFINITGWGKSGYNAGVLAHVLQYVIAEVFILLSGAFICKKIKKQRLRMEMKNGSYTNN